MRWPPLHPPEDQALQLVEALEVWGALALRENVLTRVQSHIQGKEAAGKHLDGCRRRARGWGCLAWRVPTIRQGMRTVRVCGLREHVVAQLQM